MTVRLFQLFDSKENKPVEGFFSSKPAAKTKRRELNEFKDNQEVIRFKVVPVLTITDTRSVKMATTVPTNKRLPKANIDRILQILSDDLAKRARETCSEAEKNNVLARTAYLNNAVTKHGAAKVYTVAPSKQSGYLETIYSKRVLQELKKIDARYVVERIVYDGCRAIYVPAFKASIFEAVLKGMKELELRLLTADSEVALNLAKQFESTIKGIK